MNYENLYNEAGELTKSINNLIAKAKKQGGVLSKAFENGDLKTADTGIRELTSALNDQKNKLEQLLNTLESFDRSEYINRGDFKAQIIEECEKQGVDVKEDGNILEMFPNKVVINPETQDVTVDKKKVSCLRPSVLVSSIRATQEKLSASSFNDERFTKELFLAYEQLITLDAAKKKKPVTYKYVSLEQLYKQLAPTSRAKKDYDKQSYAYDLSRLYALGSIITKDGYTVSWDTSRDIEKNAIRILDGNGKEYYLKSLKFEPGQF